MQQMLVRFLHSGTREMVLQLRALILTEDKYCGTIQHPHGIHTTTNHNSNSREPDTGFCPGMHVVLRHTCKQTS